MFSVVCLLAALLTGRTATGIRSSFLHATRLELEPLGIPNYLVQPLAKASGKDITNCYDSVDLVLKEAKTAGLNQGTGVQEGSVNVEEIDAVRGLFVGDGPAFFKVLTGAAHVYLIERTSTSSRQLTGFRLYSATADGFDLRQWLDACTGIGCSKKIQDMGAIHTKIYFTVQGAFDACVQPMSSVMKSWWQRLNPSMGSSESISIAAETYNANRDTYGGGTVLSFDDLVAFLRTPDWLGGGVAPKKYPYLDAVESFSR